LTDNKAIQEKSIADQAIAAGAFGGGREGVQRAEFQTGAARERALLQAGLLQQGFGQAQQLASQQYGQQTGLAQLLPGLQGTDISRLGSLGSLNQAQEQAQIRCTKRSSKTSSLFTTRTVTTIHWSCYRNHGRLSSGFPIF
jgi:hypothetical protein